MRKRLKVQLNLEEQLVKTLQRKSSLATKEVNRPMETGELIEIYLWYATVNHDLVIKRYKQILETQSTLSVPGSI